MRTLNFLYKLFLLPFLFLPAYFARVLGILLGRVYRFLDYRHYKEVLDRIKICFNKSDDECRKIANEFYRHLGILIIEFCRLPFMNQNRIRNLVSAKGVDVFEKILSEGKGCILVTGHFANWEYAGLGMAAHGLPVCPIAKPLKIKSRNEFLNYCRQQTGAVVISQKNAYKELLRAIRENKIVVMLLDYDTSPAKGGIFLPFFGRLASTVPTAALLQMKTGAPIVIARLQRTEDEIHFNIDIDQIIRGSSLPGKQDQILEVSTKINESLERFIIDRPAEWLWLQRRWRFDPNKLQNANTEGL